MSKNAGKRRAVYAVLFVIFLVVLSGRLYFSFQTPFFSGDKAYFHVRQVENIIDTKRPILNDPLSYSGSKNVFSPVFDYVLAGFAFIMPENYALKIIPNLFASCLVFIVFLIVRKLVDDDTIALFSAFVSGFIPVYFNETFNSLSIYSLIVPLFFLQLYFFIDVIQSEKKKSLYPYLICFVVVSFIHSSILIFVISILLYLVLLSIEQLSASQGEFEIVLFSSFFALWAQFVLFKQVIVFHGPSVIWQNIPSILLSDYFSQLTILESVYQIGIIPFIFGIYIIYNSLFQYKQREMAVLLGVVLSVSILLWARLIELNMGLVFLGVILVIYFGEFMNSYIKYFNKTNLTRYSRIITGLFFVAFILTSVLPSFSYASKTIDNTISAEHMAAFEWMRDSLPEDSVVLATPKEGNLITAVAGKKNVIDNNFLLKKDVEKRYNQVSTIYTSNFEIEAFGFIDKYSVDYILVSKTTKEFYGVDIPPYLTSDGSCFDIVYDGVVRIYEVKCELS